MKLAEKVIGLALASISVAAHAEEHDFYFSDLPVVASVSRLPQRIEDAPTAVTVIDREIIRASGARSVNDLFRLVPGFHTFVHNTESARVTYHGLTDEEYSPRVQVLIDGRSQYSPAFRDGVNWLALPVALEDIERIEVVRGTNNVSYGTNAFLGVINIITVDPSLQRGFSVAMNHGNQGVRDYTLRAGGSPKEGMNLRFTYQKRSDDGLKDRADWRDYNETELLDLRADFQISSQDALQLSLGRMTAINAKGRLQRDSTQPCCVYLNVGKVDNPMRDFDQQSDYLQLNWLHNLGEGSEFRVRYAYRKDQAKDSLYYLSGDSFYTFNGVSYDEFKAFERLDPAGGESTTHELEAELIKQLAQGLRFSGGASWRGDAVHSDYNYYGMGTVRRDVGRIFGSLEWQPNKFFTGNLGASLEEDSVAGFHASPRVAGNFHLTPEDTVRVGWSKAYRTGSLMDYQANRRNVALVKADGTVLPEGDAWRLRYLGDPNLPAEKLETREIGYLADWKALRSSLDVRIFEERIPNRLMEVDYNVDWSLCPGISFCEDRVLGPSGPTPVNKNPEFKRMVPIQNVVIRGLEYQWRWQPLEATRLMLSQAFVKINSSIVPNVDANGYLPGGLIRISQLKDTTSGITDRTRTKWLTEQSSPTHATSLLWMQKLPYNFDFSLAGYWIGNTKWSRNTFNPGYERYDMRLAHTFKLGQTRGEVAYTAQSINTHLEYQGGTYSDGDLFARVVERRHWLSLRLDL